MIGKTVSHYEILEELGGGGMGLVYKARDLKLNRLVALKFLAEHPSNGVDEAIRFIREARLASTLDHPNICAVHEIDETKDGQTFIVMAHYEGETVKKKIERGPLEFDQALDIAIQTGEGLARAHESGVTHLDIKPANVLITDRGEAKIVDFGLAEFAGQIEVAKPGTTVGTAAYMAPEQGQGGSVDHRADIWGLGTLVYEMITGARPFKGAHEQAVLYSVQSEDPAPMSSLRDAVPRSMEDIVDKALMKQPGDRYQSIEDMLADLRAARKGASGEVDRPSSRRRRAAYGAAILLVAVAAIFVSRFLPPRDTADARSIAVIPFENMNGDEENEYFSDGITEDIITQLSKIGDLRVISRNSSMRYKGSQKDIREIGRELGVGTILEGSVRREGDEVRVVAQLIDVRSDNHLWAEDYDRELTNVFDIQSDVAQQIALALRATLSPQEKRRIERKQTENLDAYSAYIRGRHHWNKRSLSDYEKSIEYFEEAIRHDTEYALAYAGLADTYLMLQIWHFGPPEELMPKAHEAALKAVEIDDNLGEAHTSLAAVNHWYLWDWNAAEREYLRAIELNPSYANAHHWYSFFLRDMGRHADAVDEVRVAQKLDPLSLIIKTNVALIAYTDVGRYEEAIAEILLVLDKDPSFYPAHERLAFTYEVAGRYEDAAAEHIRAHVVSGRFNEHQGAEWQAAYDQSGWEGFLSWQWEEMFVGSDSVYFCSFDIAYQLVRLGRNDEALQWLERAYEERSSEMSQLGRDSSLAPLRQDPRFTELLQKMKLQ
jgi:serine/threonine-protein kinase